MSLIADTRITPQKAHELSNEIESIIGIQILGINTNGIVFCKYLPKTDNSFACVLPQNTYSGTTLVYSSAYTNDKRTTIKFGFDWDPTDKTNLTILEIKACSISPFARHNTDTQTTLYRHPEILKILEFANPEIFNGSVEAAELYSSCIGANIIGKNGKLQFITAFDIENGKPIRYYYTVLANGGIVPHVASTDCLIGNFASPKNSNRVNNNEFRTK